MSTASSLENLDEESDMKKSTQVSFKGGDAIGLSPANSGPSGNKLRRAGSQVFLPRLIVRGLNYNQSANRVQVKNKNTHTFLWLALRDWFHLLLRVPFCASIPFLLAIWVCSVLTFASIYIHVDYNYYNTDCGLGDPGIPIEFPTGFAFSLQTTTTVGCKVVQWNRQ